MTPAPGMHPDLVAFLKKNPFPCMCYTILSDDKLHFFILETEANLHPLPGMQRVPMAVSYYNEGRTIIMRVEFVLSDGDIYMVETEFPWDEAGELFLKLREHDLLDFHLINERYEFLTTKAVPFDKQQYLHFLASFKEHVLRQ